MSDIRVGFKDDSDRKLSLWERFCFGACDYNYQMLTYSLTTYLMIFCTDVLAIPAAQITILMLVVRLFDAFNDPLEGTLVDLAKPQKNGDKYKIWVLLGGLGLAVTTISIFAVQPSWSMGGKLTWLYIAYILQSICCTLIFMSECSLNSRLTSNTVERGKAMGTLILFANLSNICMAYIMKPFVNNAAVSSTPNLNYLTGIIVLAATTIPFLLLNYFGCKEVVKFDHKEYTSKISLKKEFKLFFSNYQLMVPCLAFAIFFISVQCRGGVAMYYFIYKCGDANFFPVYTLISCICGMIAGQFLTGWGIKLFGGKGKFGSVVLFGCAICCALTYFVTPLSSFFLFMGLQGLVKGFMAVFMAIVHSMPQDTSDYGELKTGIRCDGFLNSMCTLGLKIGNALGPALVGVVLTYIHYQPNVEMSVFGQNWLNITFTLIPAAVCLVCGILMFTYKLNIKEHKEITDALVRKYELTKEERATYTDKDATNF